MGAGAVVGRLQHDRVQRIAGGQVADHAAGERRRRGVAGRERVRVAVAERVVDGQLRVGQADARVVQQHRPRAHPQSGARSRLADVAEQVAPVADGGDPRREPLGVALRVGTVVGHPVLQHVHLAARVVGIEEEAGVVEAGDRQVGDAEVAGAADEILDSFVHEVPRIAEQVCGAQAGRCHGYAARSIGTP